MIWEETWEASTKLVEWLFLTAEGSSRVRRREREELRRELAAWSKFGGKGPLISEPLKERAESLAEKLRRWVLQLTLWSPLLIQHLEICVMALRTVFISVEYAHVCIALYLSLYLTQPIKGRTLLLLFTITEKLKSFPASTDIILSGGSGTLPISQRLDRTDKDICFSILYLCITSRFPSSICVTQRQAPSRKVFAAEKRRRLMIVYHMMSRRRWRDSDPTWFSSNTRKTSEANFVGSPLGKNCVYILMNPCSVRRPLGQSLRNPLCHCLISFSETGYNGSNQEQIPFEVEDGVDSQ